MEYNKDMSMADKMCHGCACGCGGSHHHTHVWRLVLGLVLMIIVFCFGMGIGELKGQLETYERGGHQMMYQKRVNQYQADPSMMNYGQFDPSMMN